jgi:hypothetical protein
MEARVRQRQRVFVWSIMAVTTLAAPASAQPAGTPAEVVFPAQPVSKSDEHRVVGKVLEVDRERQRVKLDSDEGIVVLWAPPRTVRAIRVGETVSVPRHLEEPVSASPRE